MTRNLSREEIIDVVTDISDDLLEDLGFELVEVEYEKEEGEYFLRIFVHKDGGLGIDDCQEISRVISDAVDEQDPIPGAYYLEVSSPGLDRPIVSDKDLNRNLDNDIEVRLYKAMDKRKSFEGRLKSYTKDTVTIVENDGEDRVFNRELISLMRLVIKF